MNLPSFWSCDKAEELVRLAQRAGAATLQVRAAGGLNTQVKGDGSPVTCADHASQSIIVQGLRRLTPDIPIVAEENESQPDIRAHEACWLVDPLDSTREYVRGGPEFSVNIGLMLNGRPLIGVIYAPALDDLAYGDPSGVFRLCKGTRQTIAITPRHSLSTPPRIVTSSREIKRLSIQNWVEDGTAASWRVCQSAYKLSLVACGEADLFLRSGITYEWDTCAGHAMLNALGGRVLTPDGDDLTYGKVDFRNGDLLCCRGDLPPDVIDLYLGRLREIAAPVPAKGILL